MDGKVPHVLGHEVSGIVVESQDPRFPVGTSVFPHHHAPCMNCAACQKGRFVHCAQWKRTRLIPGGMAEFFGVPAENLSDTFDTSDMRPVDAALIEPLACVVKSLESAGMHSRSDFPCAVIGLGVMGLMHMLMLGDRATGYDLNAVRRAGAAALGLKALSPEHAEPAELVFVCPGTQVAFDFALSLVNPVGTIVMFAPLAPGEDLRVPQRAYFQDLKIVHSYSCGPTDTMAAAKALRQRRVCAEQVVSNFISLEELPQAYGAMKRAEILKPMVVFA